jgi:DNA repair protein RecO (recombination protein O)
MPSRERSFRVEAVVLRHSDWGEADRLLGLFTLEMGKVRAIAKGARKPRSRKAGHLEPFTRVTLQLARGKATGSDALLLVTQAETVDAYLPLHEELSRATYASYVVEILDRFTYEEGEHRALYRLLVDTLGRLAAGPQARESPPHNQPNAAGGAVTMGDVVTPEKDLPLDIAVRFYEMRLLDLVGFRPELFHCLVCKEPIQAQNQYFSAEKGGALCPKCGLDVPEAKPVSTDVLRYLRHFQRSNWTEAARAPLSVSLNRELEMIIHYYLTYVLERSLNTPRFIREVRKISYPAE